MDILGILSLLLAFSALFAWLNIKFLNLPTSIVMMLFGILSSGIILLLGLFVSDELIDKVDKVLIGFNFSDFLLDIVLSFLLFAGALHIDLKKLAEAKWPILSFASLGVLMSTFLIGTLLYYSLLLAGSPIPYIHCLLFGSIISPTDPIAVLGIMKKMSLPKMLETKISGESLFNDGIAVVIFATLFDAASKGTEALTFGHIGFFVMEEIGGGVLLGLATGYIGYYLLKAIDHYQTEVLITLALVLGSYYLASQLHFSGPLAVVIAGLIIGRTGTAIHMSDTTRDYVNKFWEMIDEILNTALFLLMGLEVLIISFTIGQILIGLIISVSLIFIRYFSLLLPSLVFGFLKGFKEHTLKILTWGGLRGGISIALALSLPMDMNRSIILTITYVVVVFSIFIQGLSIEKFINYYEKKEV